MFFEWRILILFFHMEFFVIFRANFSCETWISTFFAQIITWLFIFRGKIVPKLQCTTNDQCTYQIVILCFFHVAILNFLWLFSQQKLLKNTTNRSERVQMSRFISTDNRELKTKCLATQPVTDSFHWICLWIFNAQHWYVFVSWFGLHDMPLVHATMNWALCINSNTKLQ